MATEPIDGTFFVHLTKLFTHPDAREPVTLFIVTVPRRAEHAGAPVPRRPHHAPSPPRSVEPRRAASVPRSVEAVPVPRSLEATIPVPRGRERRVEAHPARRAGPGEGLGAGDHGGREDDKEGEGEEREAPHHRRRPVVVVVVSACSLSIDNHQGLAGVMRSRAEEAPGLQDARQGRGKSQEPRGASRGRPKRPRRAACAFG